MYRHYLNAILDCESNQLFVEFQITFNSKTSLFAEDEISDRTVKLIDSSHNDSNECIKFSCLPNENIGQLQLDLFIEKTAISFKNISFGHLNVSDNSSDCILFNLDSNLLNGLCLENKIAPESSPIAHLSEHSIGICFYFAVGASIVSNPEPRECDESICAILHGPSVDLLNDWVFCGHSHSNDAKEESHEPHIRIPEQLLKPIVLDRIEQVIYLLIDSPEILLESFDNKDDSIYLQFSKRYCFNNLIVLC